MNAVTHTTLATPAIKKNGASQRQCCASLSPNGIPTAAATENAVIMIPTPAARRTVRTISIDDSGVWSSGRNDADAQIAREADVADKAARKARNDDDRAVGS